MRTILPVVMAYIGVFLLLSSVSGAEHVAPITAILGAFDEEVEVLEGRLTDRKEQNIEGIRCMTGEINEKQVVVARTGVGKVNAAMTTTLLIEHFRPSEVIFTGVAGGINPDLLLGDIVIAAKTAQHDLGRLTSSGLKNRGAKNPIDGQRNPIFFPVDARLLKAAEVVSRRTTFQPFQVPQGERFPRITKGIVVTGDVFVASEAKRRTLREHLQADAVEMEGAAVAQICWQQRVPCLVIRSISDSANADARQDFKKYYKIAAQNSAALVVNIVKQLHVEETLKANETVGHQNDPRPNAQDTPSEKYTLTPSEQRFQEMLSDVTLVGHFTITGQENGNKLQEEKYTIIKVTRLSGDYWLFLARIQYGGKDVTVPLPLEVKWADDTPVITLTDRRLPRLGTYTARVLIYRGQYAGTWSSDKHGGHLFGSVIKNTPDTGNTD
jgi:adenosylhomocysteine nucleosidase